MSSSVRAGFWAGLLAGGVATTAITLGLFTGGLPVLALALWERTLRAIPMDLFAFFIVRLKFAAKPSAYWGMLAAATMLWGVLGAVLGSRRARPVPRAIIAWAVSAVVLGGLTYGPATQALEARRSAVGQIGSAAPPVLAAVALVAFIYALVFALVSAAMQRRPRVDGSGPERTAAGMTRRELIQRAMLLALAGMAGTAAARWAQNVAARTTVFAQSLFARIQGLPPEITPNDRFYVVSKNAPGFDPAVDGDRWLLQVGGLVEQPIRMTYQQLRALPAVEQFQTLECISNEVGGDLISNAKWKGVRLRDLLSRAGGPGAKAVKVAFHCADGYTESIPFGDAMNPTTLLVYEMNGEPLPKAHGFPARLLVPGLFGMKNPKWITRVEVVDYDFQGYWEKSGWSDEAVVKTMSKVTTLQRTVPLGEVPVGGVAYAGDRGIKEVEYSVDGGKSWQSAEVKPPLGPFTWVLWAAVWRPAAPGEYTVKVRAKDGGGVLQSAKDTATLPDGASGYQTLRVRVRK
jgi:DMSO/TMAO reductase YedYZ molybdopterin-dependent catalytic subunit